MKLRGLPFADRVAAARTVNILTVAIKRGASLRRAGGEWVGPCPVCGGRDRFSINIGKGLFNCRGCQVGGDVVKLVQHLDACDVGAAIAQFTGQASVSSVRRLEWREPQARIRAREFSEVEHFAARAIWDGATDPRGTVGEEYLRRRGLQLPPEWAGEVVRFHDALYFDMRRLPGLVALFRDALTDAPRAIQRIFLEKNGERAGRRVLGPVRGAAIKLDGDAEVVEGLCIGEGLETCMAARALGFKPVWAVGSAGAIQTFPVLPGIDALSILLETDDDGANERAALECARRWAESSREVLLVTPLLVGDMNDVALRCANVD